MNQLRIFRAYFLTSVLILSSHPINAELLSGFLFSDFAPKAFVCNNCNFPPHPPGIVHPYTDAEYVILKTLLFYICIKSMWKVLVKAIQ
jgi:hypothetical protein